LECECNRWWGKEEDEEVVLAYDYYVLDMQANALTDTGITAHPGEELQVIM
jgi:hypothetical protein